MEHRLNENSTDGKSAALGENAVGWKSYVDCPWSKPDEYQ
jgi:hypothetical protein